jgi:hypothetical protein
MDAALITAAQRVEHSAIAGCRSNRLPARTHPVLPAAAVGSSNLALVLEVIRKLEGDDLAGVRLYYWCSIPSVMLPPAKSLWGGPKFR